MSSKHFRLFAHHFQMMSKQQNAFCKQIQFLIHILMSANLYLLAYHLAMFTHPWSLFMYQRTKHCSLSISLSINSWRVIISNWWVHIRNICSIIIKLWWCTKWNCLLITFPCSVIFWNEQETDENEQQTDENEQQTYENEQQTDENVRKTHPAVGGLNCGGRGYHKLVERRKYTTRTAACCCQQQTAVRQCALLKF